MGKKKHEEGHGGAWKVAYADFVTAMMALFMVLWIASQDEKVVIATADYFKNPFNPIASDRGGIVSLADDKTDKIAEDGKEPVIDSQFLRKLEDEFYKALKIKEKEDLSPIDIIVTSDGIKIVVYNRPQNRMFLPDSNQMTAWGDFAMSNISWILNRFDIRSQIDVYVPNLYPRAEERLKSNKDAKTMSSWDFALQRGNVIMRNLIYYGLPQKKIDKITGSVLDYSEARANSLEKSNTERIEISVTILDLVSAKKKKNAFNELKKSEL